MCTDQKVQRCQNRQNGKEYCCNMSTVSGSCDNCGTRCPDATADTVFPCCTGCFVPPTITTTTTLAPPIVLENICFPSTAQVNLENGKSVKMFELEIGDRIQTGRYLKYFIIFFPISVKEDQTKVNLQT